MVHEVNYNGVIHEFPDEATPEMISHALGLKSSNKNNNEKQKQQQEPEQDYDKEYAKKLILGSSPFEQIKSGLIGMGKGGENIASTVTGGYAPKVMDDVEKMVGGSKSPISEGLGKYGPLLAMGPQGLLKEMLYSGVYTGLQNPENPIESAVEGSVVPAGLRGLGSLKKLFTPLKYRLPVELVQKGHDLLDKESTGIYDLVKEKAKDMKINISDDAIKDAQEYLPDTRRTKRLIELAQKGDYDSIHSLQSELGKLGSKGLSHELPSANIEGKEMLDVRDRINDQIEKELMNSKNPDLAHLLRKGRSKYKEMMDTYYEHPAIGRMVHPELRKVPKNTLNLFSEESKPMSKIIERHPEIKDVIDLHKSKKEILSKLKNIGIASSITGGAALGAPYAVNLLKKLSSGD